MKPARWRVLVVLGWGMWGSTAIAITGGDRVPCDGLPRPGSVRPSRSRGSEGLAVVPWDVVTGVRREQPRRYRHAVGEHCSDRASAGARGGVGRWSGMGGRRPTRSCPAVSAWLWRHCRASCEQRCSSAMPPHGSRCRSPRTRRSLPPRGCGGRPTPSSHRTSTYLISPSGRSCRPCTPRHSPQRCVCRRRTPPRAPQGVGRASRVTHGAATAAPRTYLAVRTDRVDLSPVLDGPVAASVALPRCGPGRTASSRSRRG